MLINFCAFPTLLLQIACGSHLEAHITLEECAVYITQKYSPGLNGKSFFKHRPWSMGCVILDVF
jgi:hypothetical protein